MVKLTPIEQARKSVKNAFLMSAFVGIIILLMFLSTTATGYSILITLIPMIGYIIYGHQLASKHKYMSEFADSVYFLGFTFTLMALLGATIFEKLQADPAKTISYFGMALSTTIAGLLYRNYHMQFTDLSADPMDRAKKELEDEVIRFKTIAENIHHAMEGTTKELQTFAEFLKVEIPKTLTDTIDNIDNRVITAFGALETNLSEMEDIYSDVYGKIKNRFEKITKISDDTVREMSVGVGEISSNIKRASAKIQVAIDDAHDVSLKMSKNMNELNEGISGQNGSSSSIKQSIDAIEGSTNNLMKLSGTIEKLNKSYESNVENLENTSKLINQETKRILKTFKDVEKLSGKKFE